ncbi:hypothetical protein Fcan01_27028 [Folsomia candida]|uniref:Uncharacterized protein n=1 Tax=Folsomia candida TaxID=158441 RepID=A0A226D0K8_FOLCA|nr:hypothetical protein Fcan01_27028 [Folsomia candida]
MDKTIFTLFLFVATCAGFLQELTLYHGPDCTAAEMTFRTKESNLSTWEWQHFLPAVQSYRAHGCNDLAPMCKTKRYMTLPKWYWYEITCSNVVKSGQKWPKVAKMVENGQKWSKVFYWLMVCAAGLNRLSAVNGNTFGWKRPPPANHLTDHAHLRTHPYFLPEDEPESGLMEPSCPSVHPSVRHDRAKTAEPIDLKFLPMHIGQTSSKMGEIGQVVDRWGSSE